MRFGLLRTAALGTIVFAFIGTQSVSAAPVKDGSRDFDFEIGTWKTHLKRLKNPLSGAAPAWVEYDGTSVVSKILDGRANLVELRVTGSAGTIEGLSLRLYEPEGQQWTLNFVSMRDGKLSTPAIGAFENGRGTFYGQDSLGGKAIFVRFVIQPSSADAIHFEQAFSADGGKSWEVNWIADDVRAKG